MYLRVAALALCCCMALHADHDVGSCTDAAVCQPHLYCSTLVLLAGRGSEHLRPVRVAGLEALELHASSSVPTLWML
jgi:hypothetical protein